MNIPFVSNEKLAITTTVLSAVCARQEGRLITQRNAQFHMLFSACRYI